jgi:hypothetical protein
MNSLQQLQSGWSLDARQHAWEHFSAGREKDTFIDNDQTKRGKRCQESGQGLKMQ